MKEDTISRQAAIKALSKEMPSLTTPDGTGPFDHDIQIADEAFVDAMQIINDLPSAQLDRSLLFRIGEICVDESKWNITAEVAIEKIRELLRAGGLENG